jgi:hypothetical protein
MISVEKYGLPSLFPDRFNYGNGFADADIIALAFRYAYDDRNFQILRRIGNGPYAVQSGDVEMADGDALI